MKQKTEQVSIRRDCQAILIPAGLPVTLLKGSEVLITQALGDSYTVNDHGRLLRVAGRDADALGKKAKKAKQVPTITPQDSEHSAQEQSTLSQTIKQVRAQLKTCYDPEIPVNIVDLGLIYHLDKVELLDGRSLMRITMTLTAAGCGMGAVLAEDIRQKVLTVPGVDVVEVEMVYDPPWSREMMSDAAKLQLGLL